MEYTTVKFSVLLILAVAVQSAVSQERCPDARFNASCDFLDKTAYARSKFRGDPHFTTWDGFRYVFGGQCSYVLVHECDSQDIQEDYAIYVDMEPRKVTSNQYRVKTIGLSSYMIHARYTCGDNAIYIQSGRDQFEAQLIPYMTDTLKVFAPDGYFITNNVVFRFGPFRISFNCKFHMGTIWAPRELRGQLCGLCGSFNNNPVDDRDCSRNCPSQSCGDSGCDINALGEIWKVASSC